MSNGSSAARPFSKQGLVAGLDLAALWEDPPWQAS